MRKQFNNIDIYAGIQNKNGQQWQKDNGITANWRTPEQIDIQQLTIFIECQCANRFAALFRLISAALTR